MKKRQHAAPHLLWGPSRQVMELEKLPSEPFAHHALQVTLCEIDYPEGVAMAEISEGAHNVLNGVEDILAALSEQSAELDRSIEHFKV